MMKKSVLAALGALGVVMAGAVATSTPAAAYYGYGWYPRACGPWNGWCRYYYYRPGYSFYFGYGKPYWGHYGYNYGYKYGYKHGHKHGHYKH